jgi:hypothetical protein
VVFRSRPRIKEVFGVVARAAFSVALLMPWLVILAWLLLASALVATPRSGDHGRRTFPVRGDSNDRAALCPVGLERDLGTHA